MTKTEKVNFVIKTLNNLYPEIPMPLEHKDPYTLLIAVLLSAQCTDVRVNKITPILFANADNPYDMIKMSVEEIKAIIRPCGLSPMKSKGIHGLSKILIDKLNYGGFLRSATDNYDYAHQILSCFTSQKLLTNTANGFAERPIDRHYSKFEKKALQKNSSIYEICFKKN